MAIETGNGAFARTSNLRDGGYIGQAKAIWQDANAYVRTHDLQQMKTDAATQIRRHPLAAVGAGLALGYLLGKLLK